MERTPFDFLPEKCQECQEPECFRLAHIQNLITTFDESSIPKMEGETLTVKQFLNYNGVLADKEGVLICQSDLFNPG